MKTKLRFGDIVEIQTKRGMAYAQYTHYHAPLPNWGNLVRVLPGFYSVRPTDMKTIVTAKEAFSTFFPVQNAVNRGWVQFVGHEEVPEHARKFPLFRVRGLPKPLPDGIVQWGLWDGVREWRVGQLTDEQLDLPILSIVTHTRLVEKIEKGWTPRLDEEFIARARAKQAKEGKLPGRPRTVKEMRHYLVLKDRKSALKAVERIGELGLPAGMTDLDDAWGVNVRQPDLDPGKIEEVTAALEKIAEEVGGSYDGSQVELGEMENQPAERHV